MRFNGTAVYVYNVIPNTIANTNTGTNLTFAIDGALVGTFTHTPSSSTEFDYNTPVHSSTDLKNQEHTLVIQTVGDTSPSLILFDYVVYTFTDDSDSPASTSSSSIQPTGTSIVAAPPSSNSSRPIAPIVGGVIGGVAALLLLGLLFLFLCRRARKHQPHVHVQDESPVSYRLVRPGVLEDADSDERLVPTAPVNEVTDVSRGPVSSPASRASHDAASRTIAWASASTLPSSPYGVASPPSSPPSGGYIHDSSGRAAAWQPQVMPSQVAALRKDRERSEERTQDFGDAPPSYHDHDVRAGVPV